jgi:hypothetical protein
MWIKHLLIKAAKIGNTCIKAEHNMLIHSENKLLNMQMPLYEHIKFIGFVTIFKISIKSNFHNFHKFYIKYHSRHI